MKQLFILFLSLSLLTSCIEKQSVKPTSSNSQRWLSNSPVRMNDQSKRTVRIMPQSINDITISAPPESTAYLVFNNSSRENMIQLVKTGSSVSGEKVTRKQFLNIFGESLIKKAEKEVKKLKAMKAADLKQVNLNIKSKKDLTESKQQAQLGHVVNYYRGILTGQIKSDDKTFKQLSRNFYDYLIQPTAHLFKNKTALVIVPDGILGFLPFETLMTPDGQYLAEKYRITYTQSLKILDIVNQRQYSSNRKTLLAMGGAIYDA
ncbi:MAG: CHAT domain-containing protein, partial [Methylococcales bacterium]|nr:CHAT domain-containing protein [Methylococcales bacterium]